MTPPTGETPNYWEPGQIEPQRGSVLKPILIGCGVVMLMGVLTVVALVVWGFMTPESGVKMANQMDEYALKSLSDHQVLNRTEKLVAYYDETISMTGTEAAILTTERVLYFKDGRTTSIALRDITDIQHHNEPLTGDVIEVIARDGSRMRIEIAPLNDGEVFLNSLKDARRRASPEAPAPVATPDHER